MSYFINKYGFYEAEQSRLVKKQITTKWYHYNTGYTIGDEAIYDWEWENRNEDTSSFEYEDTFTYKDEEKLFLLSVEEFNSLVKQNKEWAYAYGIIESDTEGWSTRTGVTLILIFRVDTMMQ